MTRTILETDCVTPERRQRLFRFEPDVFSTDSLGLEWEPKTRFFHVFEAGELVANASFVARTVNVAGADLPVVGIGGVVCRPEARGRGHATAAIAAALAYGRAVTGADFGMLFCLARLLPFYSRSGWDRVPGPVLIEQPAGPIASPLEVMVKPLSRHAWLAGPVRVNGKPW